MSKNLYPIQENFVTAARVTRADYHRQYAQSIENPELFWGGIGRRIDWIKDFSRVKDTSFAQSDFRIRWFPDGKLNVASNCLDRHLATRGDKIAIIWEGDDPRLSEHISYRELYERVCQCANALKSIGVQKGDRVTIYLPMDFRKSPLRCSRARGSAPFIRSCSRAFHPKPWADELPTAPRRSSSPPTREFAAASACSSSAASTRR